MQSGKWRHDTFYKDFSHEMVPFYFFLQFCFILFWLKMIDFDIVRHVHREISRFCHCFLNYGEITEACVRCTKYRHETMIQTWITCKKISFYMRDSACRWRIVKNVKIFWIYVKHFWNFTCVKICRIFIGICKSVLVNQTILFLYWRNRRRLVSTSFSCF